MNFKTLPKYINIIYIIILLLFFFLRIKVDATENISFNPEKYFVLIVLILIFYFDNLFTWMIGIGICTYGIYQICFIAIYQAMPDIMDFAFEPISYHLPFSEMTSYLKHRFSYGFYIFMIVYSSLMIIFKLYQWINPSKDKRQDLDDILDA